MPIETRKRSRHRQEGKSNVYGKIEDLFSDESGFDKIKQVLDSNPRFPIDYLPNEGELTLLQLSCICGREDLFDLFGEKGADIYRKDIVNGNSCLYLAVQGRNLNIVKKIIIHINRDYLKEFDFALPSSQECINQKNSSDWSPMQLALAMQETNIAEYLIDNGANVRDTVLHEGIELNALHLAVGYGNIDVVKFLTEKYKGFFQGDDQRMDELKSKKEGYLYYSIIMSACSSGEEVVKKENYDDISRYLIENSLGELSDEFVRDLKVIHPGHVGEIDDVVSLVGPYSLVDQGYDSLDFLIEESDVFSGIGSSAPASLSPEPIKANAVSKGAESELVCI